MSTMTAFDDVTVEAEERVAILRLNDPKTLNAISPRMMGGLSQALSHIEKAEQGFRCVVLTGEGRAFCSGVSAGIESGPTRSNRQPPAHRRRTIHRPG